MTNTKPTAVRSEVTESDTARRTAPQPSTHLPGDGAMWVMVLGELIIFGGYFVIFMVHRAMTPDAFLSSQQHLSVNLGVLNTLVLLTSSWFIARSVQALRAGNPDLATRMTYAGGLCGVLFILVKSYEWWTKLSAGYTNSDQFFMFYYMITGVHMVHVLIGLIVLGVSVRELRNPRRQRLSMIESGATYWHLVDMLWIVIFALLYVMR